MVSQEEQSLTETLVDPENLDPPSGSVWTKGTKQPNQCRDAWAAILFYAQFIAIAVVAGMLGVPAVNKTTDDGSSSTFQNASSSTTDYTGLLYGECVHVCTIYLIFCTKLLSSHIFLHLKIITINKQPH